MLKCKKSALWALVAMLVIIIAIIPYTPTYAQKNESVYTGPTVLHEHSYEAEQIVPNCNEGGFTVYKCACGDIYLDDFLPPAGHLYTKKVYEASCREAGYTKFSCACGYSYVGEQHEALPHVYEEFIIAPTCTSSGYSLFACECGDYYTENHKEALGHSYKKTTKKATCTSDGYTQFTCNCGHSYKTDKVEKLGHKYTKTVVKPTYKSQGYTKYTCSKCKDSYKDSYTEKLTVSEEIKSRSGMVGRLTIPSVGVNVALFLSKPTSNKTQAIVDKKDSAALVDIEYYGGYNALFGKYYIADHNNQGFNAIKKAVPGATYAFIDFGSYTAKYLCTQNFVGRNNGNGFADKDGNKISICNSSDGIMMYTCNSQKPYITITYWERVG